MSVFTEKPGGLMIAVYVQPKASRTRLAGLHGNALKLSVSAAPVDGKANEAVIGFFAKLFRLPRSAVSLTAGAQSRNKTIFLSGVSREKALEAITETCPDIHL